MEPIALLLAASLNAGTVLAIAALGLLINEKAGVVNLGAEGLMLCGALAGFATVVHVGNTWLGLLAGMGAAAVLSLVFGWLVIWLNTNQFATGLALSLFGAGFSAFAGIPYAQAKLPEQGQFVVPLLADLPFVGPALFRQHPMVYGAVLLTFATSGWTLLNYLMDSRTGLGRFRNFRISNYALMMALIDSCRDHTIEQILALPDVKERVDLYFDHEARAKEQIQRCATVHGNLVVLDLRNEETIWATNRFTIYAMYPQCNISIHVMWGVQKQNTVFATGKSILDRGSRTNVGELMLAYGGGGHNAAGTCQVDNDRAAEVLQQLVTRINADG